MTQQHVETQVVSKTFSKFVIIFISLLAGVNLYLMVDLFWYKGFGFEHWAFTLFPFVVAIFGWLSRPKATKKIVLVLCLGLLLTSCESSTFGKPGAGKRKYRVQTQALHPKTYVMYFDSSYRVGDVVSGDWDSFKIIEACN